MAITSAIVLFMVIWFMVFFVVLPLRLTTQGERGDIVAGTHSSAPENPQLLRKGAISTLIAAIIWAVIAWVIISGIITIDSLDFFGLAEQYKS